MKLILFDVDGTLVDSGMKINSEIMEMLAKLYNNGYHLAIVGGGTLDKIKYQLANGIKYIKYIFAECGCISYIDNVETVNHTIHNTISQNDITKIIKLFFEYMLDINIPLNGNHVDVRIGMLYLSLPGSKTSREERAIFVQNDDIHSYRIDLIKKYNESFPHLYAELGGQTGIVLSPWNKASVLEYIDCNIYDSMDFYGDKVMEYGNDKSLYDHELVNGYQVINWNDTLNKLIQNYM
jgi:phosphomannomutase